MNREALSRIAQSLTTAARQAAETQDGAALERLRALRSQLIEILFETPRDADYSGDPDTAQALEAAVSACLQSGMRNYARTPLEEQLFAQCRAARSAGAPGLAALLLAWHAAEVGYIPVLDAIPEGLRPVWLRLLFEQPAAFFRPEDAPRLIEYLTELCARLQEALTSGRDSTAGQATQAFVASQIFLQSYFNERNLRPLMRARGAIIERILERQGCVLDQLRVLKPQRSRPRIGFYAVQITDGTESVFLAAHLERLDRRRYELRLYSHAEPSGTIGALCRGCVDQHVQLPLALGEAVARLRAEDLDMLVFCTNLTAVTNIGVPIAAHRIAPIQVSNGASPVTTGLRNVDYLLSGESNEPADADAHYTERLVRIAGAANCYPFQYVTDVLPPAPTVAREALSIPKDALVFFSSANFYKILPEVSNAWIEILAAVPNSCLLLMPFNPNWSPSYPAQALVLRLLGQATRRGVAPERIRILPAVPTILHLHAIMKNADVYLDAFPFTGACSLYDPLAVGLPVVALSGSTCRSLHSATILGDVGAADWVARDVAEYVRKAVALAGDGAERRRCREVLARGKQPRWKLTDTAGYAARLMPALDGMLEDWTRFVAAESDRPVETLPSAIASSALALAERRQSFTDSDLVREVALPYLGSRGTRRLLDIGACVGAMSRPFLEQGWQAALFEPDVRCQAQLTALQSAFPEQTRIEPRVVTASTDGEVTFHVAGQIGLSGMSGSPFAPDLLTARVPAVAVMSYIADHALYDLDFIKIDAEGHDFAIMRGIDFRRVTPRLLMVEFGEQFAGQDRGSMENELEWMRQQGYRSCVFTLRPLGQFEQSDWRTALAAVTVDALPPRPAETERLMGNILFFPASDREFLPSVHDWLARSLRGCA